MIYHDKNGKKYKGRLRKCKICGDEKLVRITVKGNICRKCAANMRDNSLIDKTFITINGKRRKAEIRICKKCGDKRIVRSDTSCKTGLCLKCRSSENGKKWGAINGPKTRKTGIGSYRKDALQIFREKCMCCLTSSDNNKIIVHHVDENRENNDIRNLIPMCHSCHRRLHNIIKSGISHDEAFEKLRGEKCQLKTR